MDLLTPDERRLQRICDLRRRVERDLSLGFLSNHFKHQIARSHKAVIAVVDLWQELVDLADSLGVSVPGTDSG